jgi:hypothetical protein
MAGKWQIRGQHNLILLSQKVAGYRDRESIMRGDSRVSRLRADMDLTGGEDSEARFIAYVEGFAI